MHVTTDPERHGLRLLGLLTGVLNMHPAFLLNNYVNSLKINTTKDEGGSIKSPLSNNFPK